MSVAGTMKQTPATSRPRPCARSQPRWMASSVLLGPRLRLVAPTRSTNRSSVTHRRRRTTWSWIIAMRAAGPPNAVPPSRRHGRVTSQPPAAGLFPGRPPGGVRARPGYGAGSGAGGLEELDHIAGGVLQQDLTAAGTADDVVAEAQAGLAESGDLGGDVADDEVDAVPAAGPRLGSIGHRSSGRAGWPAEQQP